MVVTSESRDIAISNNKSSSNQQQINLTSAPWETLTVINGMILEFILLLNAFFQHIPSFRLVRNSINYFKQKPQGKQQLQLLFIIILFYVIL